MRKANKKLVLSRETLRDLNFLDLGAVGGGVTTTSANCTHGSEICTASAQCSDSSCATGGSARC